MEREARANKKRSKGSSGRGGQPKRARQGDAALVHAAGGLDGEAADVAEQAEAAEDVGESDNSGHSDVDLESDADDPVPRWVVEQQESFERALRASSSSTKKPVVRPRRAAAASSGASGSRISDFAVRPDAAPAAMEAAAAAPSDPSGPADTGSAPAARTRTGTEKVVQFCGHSIHYYPATKNFCAFCSAHPECRKKTHSKAKCIYFGQPFWPGPTVGDVGALVACGQPIRLQR